MIAIGRRKKKTHVDGVGPDVKRSEDSDEETPQGPFLETPGRVGGRGDSGGVFARPGLVRCGHGGQWKRMWVIGKRENKTGNFMKKWEEIVRWKNNKKKTTATSPVICLFVSDAVNHR